MKILFEVFQFNQKYYLILSFQNCPFFWKKDSWELLVNLDSYYSGSNVAFFHGLHVHYTSFSVNSASIPNVLKNHSITSVYTLRNLRRLLIKVSVLVQLLLVIHYLKELNLCHNLQFFNRYFFVTWWWKL